MDNSNWLFWFKILTKFEKKLVRLFCFVFLFFDLSKFITNEFAILCDRGRCNEKRSDVWRVRVFAKAKWWNSAEQWWCVCEVRKCWQVRTCARRCDFVEGCQGSNETAHRTWRRDAHGRSELHARWPGQPRRVRTSAAAEEALRQVQRLRRWRAELVGVPAPGVHVRRLLADQLRSQHKPQLRPAESRVLRQHVNPQDLVLRLQQGRGCATRGFAVDIAGTQIASRSPGCWRQSQWWQLSPTHAPVSN